MRLKALIIILLALPLPALSQDFRARYTGETTHVWNVLPDSTRLKVKRTKTKLRVSFIYRDYIAQKIKLVTRTGQATIPIKWRKTYYRTSWHTGIVYRENSYCRQWLRLYFEPVDLEQTLFVTTVEELYYCPGRKFDSWTAISRGLVELQAVNEN